MATLPNGSNCVKFKLMGITGLLTVEFEKYKPFSVPINRLLLKFKLPKLVRL